MKNTLFRILELALLSAGIALGVFTLSRFRAEAEAEGGAPVVGGSAERSGPVRESSGSFGSAALTRSDDPAVREDPEPELDPANVAALFGWKPPVVLAAPPEPEPEEEPVPEPAVPEPSPPVPADWLSFVGKVTEDGGGERLFFKNRKTGRLERASGDGSLEWKILERTDGITVLEQDGERYTAEVK